MGEGAPHCRDLPTNAFSPLLFLQVAHEQETAPGAAERYMIQSKILRLKVTEILRVHY